MQINYWQEAMESFTTQAKELRKVTAEAVAATSTPLKAHLFRESAKR